MVDFVTAAHGAARGVDAEHDRLDGLVLGNLVELGPDEAVAPEDGPGDAQNGHLARRRLGERVILLDHAGIPLEIL